MANKKCYPSIPSPSGGASAVQLPGFHVSQGGPTQTTTYHPPPAAPPPPASQPPAGHPHNQRKTNPLPVRAALLPFKLAHRAFGIACKVTLGPVRAALGQQIPLSNRRHLVLLPERLERLLGTQAFFKAKAKQALLPGRHADVQLVTRVACRIIAALPQPAPGRAYAGHLARCEWEFAVVHSPTVNAVVVPGGKVVVYTGLLEMIGRDEDKLAAVLGHEAAHVVARHSAEGIGLRALLGGAGWLLCSTVGRLFADARLNALREKLAQDLADVDRRYVRGSPEHANGAARAQARYERALEQAGRSDAAVRNAFGTGVRLLSNLLVDLPNSRRAESEADLIGLRLMAQAGYDIHGAPEVWDDFDRQASTPGGAAALLSTHPSNATRKAALHKEVASMKALGWRKGYVPPASLEMSAAGRGYFAL